MPIQMFFAWRIKLLTKSTWIPAFVVFLSIVSLGESIFCVLMRLPTASRPAGGIWTAVQIATVKVFARKPELHNPALLWFLSSCIADIVIAFSLVLSLVCCYPSCKASCGQLTINSQSGERVLELLTTSLAGSFEVIFLCFGMVSQLIASSCSDRSNWLDNVGS